MNDLVIYGVIGAALLWFANAIKSFFANRKLDKLDGEVKQLQKEEVVLQVKLDENQKKLDEIPAIEEAKTDEEADATLRKHIK